MFKEENIIIPDSKQKQNLIFLPDKILRLANNSQQ